ncbi:hypothetical protein HDK64DRAFT_125829 [Phyllosticta capitalensis]
MQPRASPPSLGAKSMMQCQYLLRRLTLDLARVSVGHGTNSRLPSNFWFALPLLVLALSASCPNQSGKHVADVPSISISYRNLPVGKMHTGAAAAAGAAPSRHLSRVVRRHHAALSSIPALDVVLLTLSPMASIQTNGNKSSTTIDYVFAHVMRDRCSTPRVDMSGSLSHAPRSSRRGLSCTD